MVKNPPDNVRDMALIQGLRRSPGEGNGNTLQYSCLGNPMDRGSWWATVHGGHKELDTTERLKGCTLPGWKGDRIPSAASFDHRAFL